MNVTEAKFALLDQVSSDYLSGASGLTDRWLFEQTLYTASVRRLILQYFPFVPHTKVLDAGTGFGILALELAGQLPVNVMGVDVDDSKLSVAKELQSRLNEGSYFYSGSEVQFRNENLYALSFKGEEFDSVISRFVYQHLDDPMRATRELYRVMRAGGYICIIDVDDQFSITYPESKGAMQKLEQAFAEMQAKRGGDRFVGRKLSTYLHEAGFEIQGTAIQPLAQHSVIKSTDASHQFFLNRLYGAKEEMIAKDILTEKEFEQYVREVSDHEGIVQFNTNAQVVVIAKKPD